MSQFTQQPVKKVPANAFNLSHSVKLSVAGGYLVPICCIETLPGDLIDYHSTVLTRLAPMIAPIMHEMDVSVSRFFVPNRLLWDNWEKFMTNPIPDDTTPVKPYFENVEVEEGSLLDYLGAPTVNAADDGGSTFQQFNYIRKIDALPAAAYNRIWFDYFRDENLQQEVWTPLTDGANLTVPWLELKQRAWQHDYFTSCLPFAQKGVPVEIPVTDFTDVQVLVKDESGNNFRNWDSTGDISGANITGALAGQNPNFAVNELYASTSELTDMASITVQNLRWAVKLQEFLEKNARGGTRYTEIIRAHWNVISSDARLQRAEFLGYESNPVVISEVLQTSASDTGTTPQGEMAGHGLSVGSTKRTRYFCEEYGFFIAILNIRPKTAYSQGLKRMFTRWSPLDYAWPTFAHIGEQEVLNQEIYYTDDPEECEETFGYLPRYSEYRHEFDRVAGVFRTSLAYWHMGRQFRNRPGLNGLFVTCNPTTRVFAVNNPTVQDQYYCQVKNHLKIRRRLPRYGVPTI